MIIVAPYDFLTGRPTRGSALPDITTDIAMWSFFAWLLTLGAAVIIAWNVFHLDAASASAAFLALSPWQKVLGVVATLMALSFIGYAAWQAHRLARQNQSLKSLRKRLNSPQQAMMLAYGSQK